MNKKSCKKKKHGRKKQMKSFVRVQIIGICMIAGILMLVGGTFAWFNIFDREAESKPAEVMKPYTLVLQNSSESAALQLSVGSLMPGQTKQILFCVSNKENEDIVNMGGSDFEYSMELIYTENLALEYKIYEVVEVADNGDGVIVAADTVIVDGEEQVQTTYWKKKLALSPLVGADVSARRHEALGLAGTEINSGKYISYAKDDIGGFDNNLHLTSDGNGYAAQHFVLEIEWDNEAASNFNKYEKETDMIYILVKAIQPKPELVTE